MRVLRNTAAVVLAAAFAAGCGDDNNGSGDFDPAGMSADMDAIIGVLENDASNSYLTLVSSMSAAINTPVVAVTSEGIRYAGQPRAMTSAARDVFGPTAAALSAGDGMAAITIPNELLGTTFEWNTETGEYEPTETPGAPANGVRFVLYAVNPTNGQIALPLNEVGHVDMIDGSTASTDALRILVVSGGATYIDYGIAYTPSETSDLVVVDGFITDGDETLNFDLSTTFNGNEMALDYALELEDRDVTMNYTVDLGSTTVELTFEVAGPNGTLTFTGGGNTTVETYVFEVNGEEFATLTFEGENDAEWVSADGDPLTSGELEVLESAYSSTFTGFLIASVLMQPVFGAAL